MQYVDFHTHHPSREGEIVLQDGIQTWGIHPWRAHLPYSIPQEPASLFAIGECGLDIHSEATMEIQIKVLKLQLQLAEEWHLPTILHCVKCIDQLILLHKTVKPAEPWIIHGFRGKPQQLRSLLNTGFYISFGFRFNQESLLACPTERLLLETDEETSPISLLYQEVAKLRGVSIEMLAKAMQKQYQTLFAK